jgi:signal transduction histidine kinase
VRVAAGMLPRRQRVSLADFVSDVKISASLEAHSRGCTFTAGDVDPVLALDVDREMLLSAVGNLLQNGFKFTRPNTEVLLSAYAVADRIRIEIEDHCGGLPVGFADNVFLPFNQRSSDKSGLGLGLSICRRSIEANNGVLRVLDIPGSGCVFTIELPRQTLP